MSQQPGAHAVSADTDHLEVTISKCVKHKQLTGKKTFKLDSFITECLSVRLLIMFLVARVLPQLSSRSRNAIKDVDCAQTSFPLRNAFKYPVYKKMCTLT